MYRSIGFASVGLVVLVGCASSTETPRGADESTETTTTSGLEEIVTQPLAETSPETATSTALAALTCEAGDSRACKQTYVDAQGTGHCLSSTQFCSVHGNGWLPCGEVPTEEDAGAK